MKLKSKIVSIENKQINKKKKKESFFILKAESGEKYIYSGEKNRIP